MGHDARPLESTSNTIFSDEALSVLPEALADAARCAPAPPSGALEAVALPEAALDAAAARH
jgi:hypothetical protein